MRAPRRIVALPGRLALGLGLAASVSLSAADVIRLKNGATLKADSWQVSGDLLIVHQGGGRIMVPRSEVERIDKDDPAAASSPPPSGPAAAGPAPSGGAGASSGVAASAGAADLSDEQARRLIDELKTRIERYPLSRAENTRRLVALLNQLGGRALKGRDYDSALGRFREAASYDAHDARAQLGLAVTYARTDQDIFARTTLERALVEHPDDAEMHALLGDVYYGEERIDDALKEWKKAYELRPGDDLKSKIDKLLRERRIDGSYLQSEAAHFTLKYDGDRAGPDLGSQILDYLEDQFRALEIRFDHYPLQPIVVILYPQRQFYEATQADSSVGGLYDGKIRVPIGGLQQLNAQARRVLVHELAHAFIAGKSHGTAPRWLHEGLAQLLEGKSTATATGVSLAGDFSSMENKETWGNGFSYASALSFVEYLDERLGFPVLVDVLDAMARGETEDAAFRSVARDSLLDLRLAWGESLVRKYLH